MNIMEEISEIRRWTEIFENVGKKIQPLLGKTGLDVYDDYRVCSRSWTRFQNA